MHQQPKQLIISLFLSALLFTTPLSTACADGKEDALKTADLLSSAFEGAAEIITPSVVTVSSVVKAKPGKKQRGNRQDPFFDPLKDLFGDDFMDRVAPDQDGFAKQGMGTGVIVDSDGHILTNNHVVGGADEVTVILSNEKRYTAKIIGTDPKTDLAVVKISGVKVSPAKLGDSDKLKIGEWVIAAGNPFAFTNSITAGIVSAKGRSVMGGGQFEDFIQTDAAINPGNSGGPLTNLRGEVVGINTAIVSRSGGYMGIGFAIPINMARTVMNSLIKSGKVTRGWLGVGIQPVTDEAAASFGYEGTEGALVGHIDPAGPAGKAGIRQGDIITALNGKKIHSVNDLRNFVASLRPKSNLDVELFRDGKSQTLSVEVGELPRDGDKTEPTPEVSKVDIGITVESLSPPLARQLGSTKERGVVVTTVQPGSPAESAGLQPRDIIISVNGKAVNASSDFYELLEKANLKKGVRFVVDSGGMEHFVFLKSED